MKWHFITIFSQGRRFRGYLYCVIRAHTAFYGRWLLLDKQHLLNLQVFIRGKDRCSEEREMSRFGPLGCRLVSLRYPLGCSHPHLTAEFLSCQSTEDRPLGAVCVSAETNKTIKKFPITYARLSDIEKMYKYFFHTHLDTCFENCFSLTLYSLPRMQIPTCKFGLKNSIDYISQSMFSLSLMCTTTILKEH